MGEAMPRMHMIVHKANWFFDPERIDEFPMEVFDELGDDGTFADAVRILEMTESPGELAYIDRWPKGQIAAVSAAIRSCLFRTPKMPITFAWAPAYDYEITIWESAGVEGSPRGEMTIMFRSRYPGDENPVTLPAPI